MAAGRAGSIRFIGYMNMRIERLTAEGRYGTATNYLRARNSFSLFLGGGDISFGHMTPVLMGRYQTWLRSREVVRNTVSFYMRILRAVFRYAVREGLASRPDPFVDVYTGIDSTRKRAMDCRLIGDLRRLDLAGQPQLSFARDLFMCSLYLRGMSFVDMAYLRKSDLCCGVVSYARRKTGAVLNIRVEPCLQRILDRYEHMSRTYLLPIIASDDPAEAYGQYRRALNNYNRRLKLLSGMLGCELRISSYMARHTWATTARDSEIPISVISAGMGHSSESVTRIYLDSLENTVVDDANRRVLSMFE